MVKKLLLRHLYWLLLAFVAWQGLKWLWDYITPKYEQNEEEEDEDEDAQKRREKREKKKEKPKVKYLK
mgnify:CR=1 FL=1